jgi:Outer membrane protein beta-barrel domain
MKLFLFLSASVCLTSAALGGAETYSSKNIDAAQPSPSWYADNEWNVSAFGSYAFTGNEYERDRYLSVDHAWGGGIGARYFWHRYFGFGFEGTAFNADRTVVNQDGVLILGPRDARVIPTDTRTKEPRAVGEILGSFTFRYPISRTRIAPFLFFGGGAMLGGGQADIIRSVVSEEPNELEFTTKHTGGRTELVGQLGAGFEVRLTPHIGLIQEFTWNIVDGEDNNFYMARAGVNFSF